MNQLPVRSNGAGGRAFAMFSGASALNCFPGSEGSAVASAGAFAAGVPPGASAGDGALLQAEVARLAEVTIATAIRVRLMIGMRLRTVATSSQACRDVLAALSVRGRRRESTS